MLGSELHQNFSVFGSISRKNATDFKKNRVSYRYDALNRITDATGASTSNYDVSGITYDKNGNIRKLNRKGPINSGATSFGNMDLLSFDYNTGNKLQKVTDSGNTTYGFKDGNRSGNDYTYDANGNTKRDLNKNITNINYNHLNLPTQIAVNGKTINYVYDANGTKLKKTYGNSVTEYAGGFRYVNGTLQDFKHAEGYVTNNNGSFKYAYNYLDHLGSIRLTYSDLNNNGTIEPATEILDEKHYYPFGATMEGFNTTVSGSYYPFGYNGKEEMNEEGLASLDFGARIYDKYAPHWLQIDPKAEQMRRHSPYNYAFNNPIRFIDPDGMKPQDIIFIDRNKSKKSPQLWKYQNGSFYKMNAKGELGEKYDPNKHTGNKTLAKLSKVYSKIESSNSKRLKKQLHKLENSKKIHWVEEGNGRNSTQGKGYSKSGNPIGTHTQLDFSDEFKSESEKADNIKVTDFSILSHEMQHQYDYDIGNMKDEGRGNANDPAEIRAVYNENIARKLEKIKLRRYYNGQRINPKKLKNPPNLK